MVCLNALSIKGCGKAKTGKGYRMSKLKDKEPIGGGTEPMHDYCTKQGAEILAARLIAYHLERGRRIEVKISPIPGRFGHVAAPKRMFGITSDINPKKG